MQPSHNCPFCKNHGHLHRCFAKGHFEICPKHGYHSKMNGCFHCIRVERAEVRGKKKLEGKAAGRATGDLETRDSPADTESCSRIKMKTGKQGGQINRTQY